MLLERSSLWIPLRVYIGRMFMSVNKLGSVHEYKSFSAVRLNFHDVQFFLWTCSVDDVAPTLVQALIWPRILLRLSTTTTD